MGTLDRMRSMPSDRRTQFFALGATVSHYPQSYHKSHFAIDRLLVPLHYPWCPESRSLKLSTPTIHDFLRFVARYFIVSRLVRPNPTISSVMMNGQVCFECLFPVWFLARSSRCAYARHQFQQYRAVRGGGLTGRFLVS